MRHGTTPGPPGRHSTRDQRDALRKRPGTRGSERLTNHFPVHVSGRQWLKTYTTRHTLKQPAKGRHARIAVSLPGFLRRWSGNRLEK